MIFARAQKQQAEGRVNSPTAQHSTASIPSSDIFIGRAAVVHPRFEALRTSIYHQLPIKAGPTYWANAPSTRNPHVPICQVGMLHRPTTKNLGHIKFIADKEDAVPPLNRIRPGPAASRGSCPCNGKPQVGRHKFSMLSSRGPFVPRGTPSNGKKLDSCPPRHCRTSTVCPFATGGVTLGTRCAFKNEP